jgi:type I restriction enzyme R subunit
MFPCQWPNGILAIIYSLIFLRKASSGLILVLKKPIKKTYENICLALDNEDLGESFSNMLNATSGVKLIDYKEFNNNSFNVVTELTYKNGDDEFRPDITLLINGMPLAFIEVKKPNNEEGVLTERNRVNVRFKNKKFRKFINMSQVLVFSNNMEYDIQSIEPIQGAFYSSTSYSSANFNCFRAIDLTGEYNGKLFESVKFDSFPTKLTWV